jgi:hypothetical protein
MTSYSAEFTVAELRDRAGEDAFGRAGADVVGMDGPYEDEWSLYTTIVLDDARELETILHIVRVSLSTATAPVRRRMPAPSAPTWFGSA